MAVAITVRDVPDDVRDELAARAARAHQSLQEYLRTMLIDSAARPPVGDVIARARARVEVTRLHRRARRRSWPHATPTAGELELRLRRVCYRRAAPRQRARRSVGHADHSTRASSRHRLSSLTRRPTSYASTSSLVRSAQTKPPRPTRIFWTSQSNYGPTTSWLRAPGNSDGTSQSTTPAYVALAETTDLTLVTLDKRLAKAPGTKCRIATPQAEPLRSHSLLAPG